ELQSVFRGEDVGHRAVGDVAVYPDLGPLSRGAMQVGGFLFDHLLEQRSQIDAHPAVSLTTSSTVVIPRSTFLMPSMRSVSMPSATAWSRSSATDAPRSTMRRSSGDIAMTS